jgi:hypothetical protein
MTANPLATKSHVKDAVQSLKLDFEAALHRQTWAFLASFSRKAHSSSCKCSASYLTGWH